MSGKRFVARLSVFFLLLQPWLVAAQPYPSWRDWDWPGPWHMWGGGWGFGWIFPLLFFGLIFALFALFLFRGPWSHHDRHGEANRSALAILAERFAKGEISKEEFEEKRAILARRV